MEDAFCDQLFQVDVIVNAANGRMQHDGGIAAAISQAAGYELDREGFEEVRKRGRISVISFINYKFPVLPRIVSYCHNNIMIT